MKLTLSRRFLSACILFCAVASAATFAKAAPIALSQGVLAGTSFLAPFAGGTFTVPYTVSNPNTNLVVVGLYIDALPAGAAAGTPTPISGLQFNGVAPNGSQNQLRDTLAYWSWVPGTTGSFNITGDAGALTGTADIPSNGYVWELSGVDLSAGVDVGAPSTVGSPTAVSLATITTSTSSRRILDFYGANRQSGGTSIAPTAGSPISPSSALQFGGGSGGTVAGGNGPAPTAGLYTLGWTPTAGTTSSSTAELAYAFAGVPEPSSLVLLVGGVLMIAGRRRIIG